MARLCRDASGPADGPHGLCVVIALAKLGPEHAVLVSHGHLWCVAGEHSPTTGQRARVLGEPARLCFLVAPPTHTRALHPGASAALANAISQLQIRRVERCQASDTDCNVWVPTASPRVRCRKRRVYRLMSEPSTDRNKFGCRSQISSDPSAYEAARQPGSDALKKDGLGPGFPWVRF